MREKTNYVRWLMCVLLLLVVARTAAAGGVIYVDADAVGANNGSSWENAYVYLQDALADAEGADKPIEIRVAQGVYTPDRGVGIRQGERKASFQVMNGVTIRGGYAGIGEPYLDARDIDRYKSILSGDLNADDGSRSPIRERENSYHIVTADRANATAVLDGFTINGGNADGPFPHHYDRGGGMYNNDSSPTLTNCTFSGNLGDGGGMYNVNSSPMLVDCLFSENSAGICGGMYNDSSSPTLLNCIFIGNTSKTYGCGMLNYKSNPTLTNCTFIGNSGGSKGGAMYNWASSPMLSDCVFSENSTTGNGGGMYNEGSNTVLLNCIFSENSALRSGGGMFNRYSGQLSFTNCIFSGNSARNGGGMENDFTSSPTLFNCTFSDNLAENAGGGISNIHNAHPLLVNCILWGNIPEDIQGSAGVSYSDVEGGWPGEGNISVTPNFAVPNTRDYHLKSQAGRWDPVSESWVQDDVTSACIDAGDPNTPVAFEPFPNGVRINMGAYGGTAEASMSPSGIHAKYGGGTGEPNDPYLIYTAEQMNAIGANWDDWDKHFKLMADIDLSGYTGTDFNIIGIGNRNAFTGVFDGNGHTISNFSYTSSNGGYKGLFRYVSGQSAQIKDLGLIAPDINAGTGSCVGSLAGYVSSVTITNCYAEGGSVAGKKWIGGLVGYNRGSLKDCYSTCSVSGNDEVGGLVGYNSSGEITNCYAGGEIFGRQNSGGLAGSSSGKINNSSAAGTVGGGGRYAGGLVGYNYGPLFSCSASGDVLGDVHVGGLAGNSSASIINCYATGGVFGTDYVGGLVGSNDDSIANCYAIGGVSGITYVGGLVGLRGHGGTIFTSFWDIETSGQLTGDGGTGKTTAEMLNPNTFMDAGWNFVGASDGPSDIWAEPDGGGCPILWWQLLPLPELPAFSGGTGGPDDPYLISTADELNSIGHNPRLMAAHFKLINDIDLAGINFFIIGGQWHPFGGTFDGNGHIISNFTYTSEYATCIGLFGYVVGGRIKDLGLINSVVSVDRGDFHGCLVGHLGGAITNCYVEAGSVSGNDYVGGLVGFSSGDWNSPGTITNCYVTGFVGGDDDVGGLVGNNVGTITDCYAIADVNGNKRVGGLVGASEQVSSPRRGGGPRPSIERCYAAGRISGDEYVGGLAGQSGGGITHCFWDTENSGQSTSAGGTGKTTAEMQMAGTFLDAGWDFVDEVANGTEDVWWILEGRDYPRLWWEIHD